MYVYRYSNHDSYLLYNLFLKKILKYLNKLKTKMGFQKIFPILMLVNVHILLLKYI